MLLIMVMIFLPPSCAWGQRGILPGNSTKSSERYSPAAQAFLTRRRELAGEHDITMDNDFIVGRNYWYSHDDMERILRLRLREENLVAIADVITPIHRSGHTDHLAVQLTQYLNQQLNRRPVVIIPYNVGGVHWVGMYIRFADARLHSPTEVWYIDPQYGEVPNEVQRSIQSLFGIDIVSVYARRQCDSSSCGPATVENLIDAVRGVIVPHTLTDAGFLRRCHLILLNEAGNTAALLQHYGISYSQKNNQNRGAKRSYDVMHESSPSNYYRNGSGGIKNYFNSFNETNVYSVFCMSLGLLIIAWITAGSGFQR